MRSCYKCGTTSNIHRHHIIPGNRKLCDKYGLVVDLCGFHHNQSNEGVHFNKEFDIEIRQMGQRKFEETHSREEWLRVFGKNWLEEE